MADLSGIPLYQSVEDQALLQSIAVGDERAFRELFGRYRNRVYGLSWQLLKSAARAEDVLQEVFLNVWTHRTGLNKVQHWKAYLDTITRNQVYNIFRKMAGEELFLSQLPGEVVAAENAAPDTLAYKELQEALQIALAALTPQQKKVFELSRLRGLKHHEIATELGLRPETVKKHMTDALRIIRAQLHTHHPSIQAGILFLLLTA